jgi:hypothetical protein
MNEKRNFPGRIHPEGGYPGRNSPKITVFIKSLVVLSAIVPL